MRLTGIYCNESGLQPEDRQLRNITHYCLILISEVSLKCHTPAFDIAFIFDTLVQLQWQQQIRS